MIRQYTIFFLIFIVANCAWQQRDFDEELKESVPSDHKDNEAFDLKEDIAEKFNISSEKKAPKKATAKAKKVVPKKVEELTKEMEMRKLLKELDQKSVSMWERFRSRAQVGEKTYLDIHYLGMTLGKVFLTVKKETSINSMPAYHFYARLKSAPFYRFVYVLDDVIESFVAKKQFIPIKYSLVQRQSGKSIDDLQLYDWEKQLSYFRYTKEKDGKIGRKKKDVPIPHYFQDSFSALFFLRGLPLKDGDKYKIPITTRDKLTIFDAEVLGRETIDTEIGTFKAIKIKGFTRYTGDLVKKGEMVLWFSDDKNRTFLRFKGEVKIGAIYGEVVEYSAR